MNFTAEEREAYENHLKWLRIETNTLKKAKEDGRKEGREEGIKKTAINMLKQKLANSLISSVTGLSNDQILKLKDNL